MIYEINPDNPQMRLIEKAVGILKDGGVIAYPTDTFYGMGCDIFNKKAIRRVYQIKKRPLHIPFSFICPDLKDISKYAKVSNYAYKTMRRLLPGPYTFILEGSSMVPQIMLTKRKTVGIRVPDNNICLTLAMTLGNPILSTSVSTEDGRILHEPSLIEEAFENQLDLVISGGILYPEPSSIISLINDVPEVLRVGKGDVTVFE
ncbi:MAG: threonylcarbamoyl-AMP synthase [Deltaproteobacteria bacterium]|nr:threonylcarbamoyl-AMP synthase [Deltaproteobacteria bacterium]